MIWECDFCKRVQEAREVPRGWFFTWSKSPPGKVVTNKKEEIVAGVRNGGHRWVGMGDSSGLFIYWLCCGCPDLVKV